jgi:hypothetical protein
MHAYADRIVTFLASLEGLRQQLVASGAGALLALDPGRIPTPADLDMTALVDRRLKETQAMFATSQRAKDAAGIVLDILSQK